MGDLPMGDAVSAPADATAVELDERYRTRPGTPMVGPYSVNQMDNFYAALAEHDVAHPWPDDTVGFDIAVYTSALEHLPRDLAVASLRHTTAALRPGGWLFLSTPNTPGGPPRPLQHRVHVYEWNTDELMPVLTQ